MKLYCEFIMTKDYYSDLYHIILDIKDLKAFYALDELPAELQAKKEKIDYENNEYVRYFTVSNVELNIEGSLRWIIIQVENYGSKFNEPKTIAKIIYPYETHPVIITDENVKRILLPYTKFITENEFEKLMEIFSITSEEVVS